jgi:hypothetical protein
VAPAGGQAAAADPPLAFLDLLDLDPADVAQGFAFDGHHHVGDLLDNFPLLLLREDVFDDLNIDLRHSLILLGI